MLPATIFELGFWESLLYVVCDIYTKYIASKVTIRSDQKK